VHIGFSDEKSNLYFEMKVRRSLPPVISSLYEDEAHEVVMLGVREPGCWKFVSRNFNTESRGSPVGAARQDFKSSADR
jgi:hypothetical protein